MHDARCVGAGQAIGDLYGLIEEFSESVGRRDWGAVDELHHKVVFADIIKLTDIWGG